MKTQEPGPRFLMWVDAVGGFLVCLDDEVVIGQALAGSTADVPVVGDLSRRHAVIRRRGEGYLVEPLAATRVDGRRINQSTVLSDGDEILLGQSFLMRFRQPHALSGSCRLDFLSSHRSQPSADAVLLMANSCVLGPGTNNHVVCRQWKDDVVLVRRGQKLRCHAQENIEVDGQIKEKKADITLSSRICGSDFCLSLERIE